MYHQKQWERLQKADDILEDDEAGGKVTEHS